MIKLLEKIYKEINSVKTAVELMQRKIDLLEKTVRPNSTEAPPRRRELSQEELGFSNSSLGQLQNMDTLLSDNAEMAKRVCRMPYSLIKGEENR